MHANRRRFLSLTVGAGLLPFAPRVRAAETALRPDILNKLVIPYFVGKDARELESHLFGVYRYRSNYKSTTHGWWYVRLRPKETAYSPLQGIVKIEVFATGTEQEDGLAEARADTISAYVLQERNVTPYNADTRWASHIYPIYLAETYLRSSFLSHERFS